MCEMCGMFLFFGSVCHILFKKCYCNAKFVSSARAQCSSAWNFRGEPSGNREEATNFRGEASGDCGEATNFRGEATNFHGAMSNFRGEASGDRGEATNFRGEAISFCGEHGSGKKEAADFHQRPLYGDCLCALRTESHSSGW